MQGERIDPLSATEYAIVEDSLEGVIWALVQKYPARDKPGYENVYFEYDFLESVRSLAVFILPGGRYKKKNVLGGFTAEINFRIAYRSNPTDSDRRINAQKFVGDIMKWLEEVRPLPQLTDGRVITDIRSLNAIPFLIESGEAEGTIYAADAVMEYEKD